MNQNNICFNCKNYLICDITNPDIITCNHFILKTQEKSITLNAVLHKIEEFSRFECNWNIEKKAIHELYTFLKEWFK